MTAFVMYDQENTAIGQERNTDHMYQSITDYDKHMIFHAHINIVKQITFYVSDFLKAA